MTFAHAVLFLIPAFFVQDFNRFARPAPTSATDLVSVAVAADVTRAHPGETFMVAAAFTMEPHWHVYWENAGAAGIPTHVKVDAPTGWTVGPMQFSRPQRFEESEGDTYGYEDFAVFYVPVTAPDTVASGTVTLDVSTNFLVCKKVCLMGDTSHSIALEVTDEPLDKRQSISTDDRAHAKILAAGRALLPAKITDVPELVVELQDGQLRITGSALHQKTVDLYPLDIPGVTLEVAAAQVRGGVFEVRADVDVKPGNALGKPMTVSGLIVLGDERSAPSFRFDLPIDRTGALKRGPTRATSRPE